MKKFVLGLAFVPTPEPTIVGDLSKVGNTITISEKIWTVGKIDEYGQVWLIGSSSSGETLTYVVDLNRKTITSL